MYSCTFVCMCAPWRVFVAEKGDRTTEKETLIILSLIIACKTMLMMMLLRNKRDIHVLHIFQHKGMTDAAERLYTLSLVHGLNDSQVHLIYMRLDRCRGKMQL